MKIKKYFRIEFNAILAALVMNTAIGYARAEDINHDTALEQKEECITITHPDQLKELMERLEKEQPGKELYVRIEGEAAEQLFKDLFKEIYDIEEIRKRIIETIKGKLIEDKISYREPTAKEKTRYCVDNAIEAIGNIFSVFPRKGRPALEKMTIYTINLQGNDGKEYILSKEYFDKEEAKKEERKNRPGRELKVRTYDLKEENGIVYGKISSIERKRDMMRSKHKPFHFHKKRR